MPPVVSKMGMEGMLSWHIPGLGELGFVQSVKTTPRLGIRLQLPRNSRNKPLPAGLESAGHRHRLIPLPDLGATLLMLRSAFSME